MAEDERKPIVQSIFSRFCRAAKPEWVDQVLDDTRGMLTGNFIRGCDLVKDLEEFPRNLSKEIRRLGHGGTSDKPLGCNLCDPPGLKYSVIDGMRVVSPCTCDAGKKYAWMNSPENHPRWYIKKFKKDQDDRAAAPVDSSLPVADRAAPVEDYSTF